MIQTFPKFVLHLWILLVRPLIYETIYQSALIYSVFVVSHFYIVMFAWVCSFVMTELKEQHICVKFCFRHEKTTPEIHKMFYKYLIITFYMKHDCMTSITTLKIAKHFIDNQHFGWLSTGNTPENVII